MRRFVGVRDTFLTERFNTLPGWSCHKCRYDPCLFVLSYDPKEPARKPYKERIAELDAVRVESFAPHLMEAAAMAADPSLGYLWDAEPEPELPLDDANVAREGAGAGTEPEPESLGSQWIQSCVSANRT